MAEMSKVEIEQAGNAWMFKGRDGKSVTLEEKLLQEMSFSTAMDRAAQENWAMVIALEAQLRNALAYKALADEYIPLIASWADEALPTPSLWIGMRGIMRRFKVRYGRLLSASSEAGAGEEAKDG